ncbi:IS66 family insertion sequence element accessory protein TnpB [Peribacillus loiseleuriae]|uniref:IS66 family insertion sequence element accessory protein TnpB n=1 Tax=Peribacillus loiseleuriae TaxID=1679170 RepID=UPI0009E658FA|nr:IS66 family insertion sequence element accessory protein TnpB [Peribacillus loiseleuriae]
MIHDTTIEQVYLAQRATDLRKSIDGLAAIVKEEFDLNPFSSSLFVFYNRSRDKVKILVWDHNGFWLYYHRLEKGTFNWPSEKDRIPLSVTRRQLRWLLDGLPLHQKQTHREVKARIIVYYWLGKKGYDESWRIYSNMKKMTKQTPLSP